MYHNIITRRVKSMDDEFTTRMTFKTSSVKDIIIKRDTAGIPIEGIITLDSTGEDGGSSYLQFSAGNELTMLVELANALETTQTYYADMQGNIFPFDKIICVKASDHYFVLESGVKIGLHPQDEFPRFVNQYTNWLDLYK